MREIKGELVRLNFAAALFDMLTKDPSQCPVQKMRGGVVLAGEFALLRDRELRFLARLDSAAGNPPYMRDGVANLQRRGNVEPTGVSHDDTAVPDLPSLLRVKASLVQ